MWLFGFVCCAYDSRDALMGVGQFMEIVGYRMGLLRSLYMSGHHIEELDDVTTQCERDNMAYSAKGQLSPSAPPHTHQFTSGAVLQAPVNC